jgi:hypothetical protein
MTDGAPSSIHRTARLAGGLYLTLAVFAAFGNLYVPSVLVVSGDAETTSRNIVASELLYRGGILSSLVCQVLFVFLVLTLYRLFKTVNKDRAVSMAVLALLGVPMALLNEVNRLAAVRLLSGADTAVFSSSQLQARAMQFLDMWESGISVTLAIWGLWLLPLSVLVFRSGFLPKPVGILLAIAGAGYVIDSGTQLLFPGIPTIGRFTFVGELLFPLWLLIKGVNVDRWRQGTPA